MNDYHGSTHYPTNHIWVSSKNYQSARCRFGLDNPLFKGVHGTHILLSSFLSFSSVLILYFSEECHTTHAKFDFVLKMICLFANTVTRREDSHEADVVRNETIKHLPTQVSLCVYPLGHRPSHLFCNVAKLDHAVLPPPEQISLV